MAIVLYKAENMVDDSALNGGYMSANVSPNNVRNNIFPNAPDAERISGSTKHRKLMWRHEHATDAPLTTSRIFLAEPTNCSDWVSIIAATQTDVEDDLAGTEQEYGVGTPTADIAATATVFTIDTEDDSLDTFVTGMTIRIADTTNEEFFTNVTVVDGSSQFTITLDSGDQVANTYTAGDTNVSSVIEAGDIDFSVDTYSKESTSGTYDEVAVPIVPTTVGTIEEDWKVTFVTATTFNVEGLINVGSIGSTTDITAAFQVTNPDHSDYYFTIPADFFTGTWAGGDWFKFSTHPSAFAVWFKRVIPAAATSCSNSFQHGITGESA